MPKALITGIGGFVGPYLARHLKTLGYEVTGTALSKTSLAQTTEGQVYQLDIRNTKATLALVKKVAPDEVYHLAGVTRPALGLTSEFYDINLYGTLNVLEAATSVDAKVLVVSSAYVYGSHAEKVTETTPLEPVNAYGASKAAADLAAISYALQGLHAVRVRPFNHSGPGQSPDFLLPTLVQQVARIEAGLEPAVIKLGNLDSVRDFSDVRDVVATYPLLLNQGEAGDVYNVASGVGVSVQALADEVMGLAKVPVALEVEPSRVRATDIPHLVGDARKAQAVTGYEPRYTLTQTLQDMLAWERERVHESSS